MEYGAPIFRALFETAPDAMLVIDSTGVIVLANPQAARMFGHADTGLVGHLIELLSEETKALYPYDDITGFLAEGAPLYNNPPIESDEFVTQTEWTDAWQEIKAGA